MLSLGTIHLGRSGVPTSAAALLIVLGLGAGMARADEPVEFNRDIRPILTENCFLCHGPDSGTRKADLRLDRRQIALEKGAIVPGDVESSEMIARITADDPEIVMPPPASAKKLTETQKDLLQRWVAAGAEYQPLWSFIAPKRPTPPPVKDEAWVKNPIDRFILAKLEERGLKPAPEADRRTLVRRLSLDLTGLPPAPADVEAFVNDTAPDAYEKLVDKLLASPRWGEHRGRYWLDAARYADTHGIHFDNFREMWTYRDEVIDAFNRNQPFDQFTIEQLAGDLLPNATLDQKIASGFNRCNITTNEGGAIDEEYLVNYTRDRTETVSQVWLGMTAGCAVCHDHKFDPLTQKEFYELSAFFNNNAQKAMDGNVKDTPPIIFVPSVPDRARWTAIEGELAGVRQQIDARKQSARPDFDKWLAVATPETVSSMISSDGLVLRAPLSRLDADPNSARLPGEFDVSDAGNFEKDQAFSYGAWIKLAKLGQGGAMVARMTDGPDFRGWDIYIDNDRVAAHVINKWPENAVKVATTSPVLKPGEWNHVFVSYDGSAKAAGLKIFVNGKPQATSVQADGLKDTIKAEVPLTVAQRHTSSKLENVIVHDLRIFARGLSAPEVEQLATSSRIATLLEEPADKRPEGAVDMMFNWWLANLDVPAKELRGKLVGLEDEQAGIKARGSIAHVMQEKPEPPLAYVLFRGEYDKRRDPVKPDTPDILPPMPPDLPRNRLGFAQWLVRPEHPLMARVTVNRFWQEIFGTGLVRTTGDFGVTGEMPSHPELLDWLAVDFRESGWDVKRFFKLLVTSAAYRQSSLITPEKLEKDVQNRLISRGPRFRMDGEMVRDYALAAGGLLSSKIGGPSVRPYQPEGIWEAVAMPGSDTRDYRRDSGESLYRRSMYTFWKRAAPPGSMDIFNAPSRETCTVRRERTDTPLQALVTLNDPQFVEAARRLAESALKEGGESNQGRLALIANRLLARPFRPEEDHVVQDSLAALLAHYKVHPDDAAKLLTVGESKADPALDAPTLAAWTMLVNELMNLDEVLNK